MSRRYNLRYQKNSTKMERSGEDFDYDEEEDISDEEEAHSSRENLNTSHRSDSDSHHSSRNASSGLSTTESDSFSFRSGHSPAARSENRGLYPRLPSGNYSPGTKRRGVPAYERSSQSSQESSPSRSQDKRSQQRLYPDLKKKHSSDQCAPNKSMFGNLNITASLALGILVILLVWMISTKVFSPPLSPQENKEQLDLFQEYSNRVDKMKTDFSGQDTRFWRVVKSCAKHVFYPKLATYPAILLMVTEKKNTMLAANIAQTIGREFDNTLRQLQTSQFESSLNLTSSTVGLNADDQKVYLDEWFRSKLDRGSAVVVNHLESLHPKAAVLLYSYCDGDDAPYKSAMIIFVLCLDKPINTDWEAEKELKKMLLAGLIEDKVGALLSRVANNIARVNSPVDSD